MAENPETEPVYVGMYRHAVDNSRRVQVPAKWRPYTSGEAPSLMLIGMPEHLLALPPRQFQLLALQIAHGRQSAEAEALRRLIGANSDRVRIDRGGRITLPEPLLTKAAITTEVELVGMMDRFAVWNPERYANRVREEPQGAELIALPESLYEHPKGLIVQPEQKIIVTDFTAELKKFFGLHPEKLHAISPRAFEQLVAEILRDMGFDVELTKASRDGGVDICAYLRHQVGSFLTLVECKQWAPDRPVGIEIVQRLYGIQQTQQANKAMIVTTSFFSQPAKKEAELHKGLMELKDYEHLKSWLKVYT